MRSIFVFIFVVTPFFSFAQEWLLGLDKIDIINQYKCECHITTIRDTMITFNCTESGFQQRAFTFYEGSCVKAWWATDIKNKNQLMEKYIGLNYNMNSQIKTINNNKAEVSEATNDRYKITIITYYTSNIAFVISTFK